MRKSLSRRFHRWLDNHDGAKLFILLCILAVIIASASLGKDSWTAVILIGTAVSVLGLFGLSRIRYLADPSGG